MQPLQHSSKLWEQKWHLEDTVVIISAKYSWHITSSFRGRLHVVFDALLHCYMTLWPLHEMSPVFQKASVCEFLCCLFIITYHCTLLRIKCGYHLGVLIQFTQNNPPFFTTNCPITQFKRMETHIDMLASCDIRTNSLRANRNQSNCTNGTGSATINYATWHVGKADI